MTLYKRCVSLDFYNYRISVYVYVCVFVLTRCFVMHSVHTSMLLVSLNAVAVKLPKMDGVVSLYDKLTIILKFVYSGFFHRLDDGPEKRNTYRRYLS